MVMYMEGASAKLEGSSEITFQTETASHIRKEFLDDLDDLTVGINVKRQELLLPATQDRRSQESTLEIIFDTAVSFKYATTNLDVAALVGAAFDTEEDRSVYLNRMGQPFAGISTFSIVINGIPEQVESSDGDGGVVIGATAGGVALVGLLLIVFFRKRKPANDDSIRSDGTTTVDTIRVNDRLCEEEQINARLVEEEQVNARLFEEDPQENIGVAGVARMKEATGNASCIS